MDDEPIRDDEPMRVEYNSDNDDPEDVEELTEEVDRGHDIASELVEHVAMMGAGGFAGEVEREGELWSVEVKMLGRMSDVKKLVE